jgi:hypothetical protein
MRHLPLKELGIAALFLVLLMAVYVGSYYAVVDRRPDEVVTEVEVPVPLSGPGGVPIMTTRTVIHRSTKSPDMIAVYPLEMMTTIYSPVHSLDRRIRREHWSPPSPPPPPATLEPVP